MTLPRAVLNDLLDLTEDARELDAFIADLGLSDATEEAAYISARLLEKLTNLRHVLGEFCDD